MRMWMVDPKKLCRKHLLGEHVELHMFVGTIKRGSSLKGYLEKGLLDTTSIMKRHAALVKEMKVRGYNHKSELYYEDVLGLTGCIDIQENEKELARRCEKCKELK